MVCDGANHVVFDGLAQLGTGPSVGAGLAPFNAQRCSNGNVNHQDTSQGSGQDGRRTEFQIAIDVQVQ